VDRPLVERGSIDESPDEAKRRLVEAIERQYGVPE
jgi:hypothetical protein